jgi:hypothetical protein
MEVMVLVEGKAHVFTYHYRQNTMKTAQKRNGGQTMTAIKPIIYQGREKPGAIIYIYTFL